MTIKGKIGCEIEGIVSRRNEQILNNLCVQNNWNMGYDGSIRNTGSDRAIEFKAGIYEIEDKQILIDKLKETFKLIKVNPSCGLHIHLSFQNFSDYYKLLSWDFVRDFQNEIERTFKTPLEKNRITNNYCKFYPSEEVFKVETETQLGSVGKDGSRYRCVNYNSCNLYKTIEFRIFPATKSIRIYQKYLNLLLKIVEKHIKSGDIEPFVLEVKHKIKKKSEGAVVIREIITKEEKEQTKKEREIITLEPSRDIQSRENNEEDNQLEDLGLDY